MISFIRSWENVNADVNKKSKENKHFFIELKGSNLNVFLVIF